MTKSNINVPFQESIVGITENYENLIKGSLSTGLISKPGSSENTKNCSNHNISDFSVSERRIKTVRKIKKNCAYEPVFLYLRRA